jgi:flagellar hook-associated protein 3
MSGWGSIYRSTSYAMRAHASELARLQMQASSGLRVIRASDDPGDANRILHLKNENQALDSYRGNVSQVMMSLEEVSNALQQISSAVMRARELSAQAATGTLNQHNRTAIANEVDSLIEQVLSLANHKSMGRYLFGGANISLAPYAATRVSGQITDVAYQGSQVDLPVPVSVGVLHSGLVVGERIFRSGERQEPVFLGNTGAAGGSGTSSVQGDVWLTATHTDTAYEAGTHGLAKGDDSDAGDTILGEHTLTVSGPNRTVQLDGGPAAAFTGTETNLRVASEVGDVVYVDVTSWSGLTETVTVTGTGALSIDGGESTTALTDFTGDAIVTDSAGGRVLYVDTTGFRRVGDEPVHVPGTYDLFGALISMRDLMENDRGFDSSRQIDLIDEGLSSLEEVMANVEEGLTTVGGRLNAMDALDGTLESLQFNGETEIAQLGDADLVQIAAEIARTQTLYEMTLASSARLLSLSLLDFIS